jgi:hypothetical protein
LVDLELTGSAQTSGTTVTMAWQITNRQSGTAMATEFVERLPQGVTLQSVSAGNGAQCITPVPDFLPQPLTCLLGVIAGGQSVSVTVVLSNPSAAALSSRALVRFIGADANYANNAWVISVPAGPSTGGTAGGGGAGGGSGSGSGGGTPPSTCDAACRVRHGIPGAARNAGPRKLSGR